jgi:RNA polymerase sigma-70 factor (ECF subfamily)
MDSRKSTNILVMKKNAEGSSCAIAVPMMEAPSTTLRAGSSQKFKIKSLDSDKTFMEVYTNYNEIVYHCILQIVGCEESSMDLMHDVFVRVLEDESCLKHVKNVGGYLCMVGRNIAIDHLRKQKRMHSILKTYSINTRQFYFDDAIVMREFHQRLHERIERLPTAQKLVYKMIRDQGHQREEVARELKISKNTVKEQMRKALKSLQKDLREVV